jgi:hypothetical protein
MVIQNRIRETEAKGLFCRRQFTVSSAPYYDDVLKITFFTTSRIMALDGKAIAVATVDMNISKIKFITENILKKLLKSWIQKNLML